MLLAENEKYRYGINAVEINIEKYVYRAKKFEEKNIIL